MAVKRTARKGQFQPKVLDEIRLQQLASLNATIEDMARILGCSRDTLERNHRTLIDRCKAEYRERILKAQLEAAEKGNPALLIWLGKQHLGQIEDPNRAATEIAVQGKIGRLVVRDTTGRVLVFDSGSSDAEEYREDKATDDP